MSQTGFELWRFYCSASVMHKWCYNMYFVSEVALNLYTCICHWQAFMFQYGLWIRRQPCASTIFFYWSRSACSRCNCYVQYTCGATCGQSTMTETHTMAVCTCILQRLLLCTACHIRQHSSFMFSSSFSVTVPVCPLLVESNLHPQNTDLTLLAVQSFNPLCH